MAPRPGHRSRRRSEAKGAAEAALPIIWFVDRDDDIVPWPSPEDSDASSPEDPEPRIVAALHRAPQVQHAVRRARAGERVRLHVHVDDRRWTCIALPPPWARDDHVQVIATERTDPPARGKKALTVATGAEMTRTANEVALVLRTEGSMQEAFGRIARLLVTAHHHVIVAAEVSHGALSARHGTPSGTCDEVSAPFTTDDGTAGTIRVSLQADSCDRPHAVNTLALSCCIAEMLRLHLDRIADAKENATRARLLAQAERMAQVGSWLLEPETGRFFISDGLYQLYGLPPGPAETAPDILLNRIHRKDVDRVTAAFTKAFTTGRAYRTEHRIVLKDGSIRWVQSEGDVDRDADGSVVLIRGVTQDITERHQTEAFERRMKELHDQNDFRTRFVSTAAHELNTPLTPIILHLDLLRSGRRGPLAEEQTAALDIVDRNLTRLSLLVQDMLDATRMQAGKLKIERRPMDLWEIVEEAATTFSESARHARVQLQLYRPEGPARVRADARRIMQIVTNLLSNALKFTPRNGHVRLTMERIRDEYHIVVRDTGTGIHPERIPDLFEPFVQAHTDTSKKGTGLGLYICRGIIEQHGGRIWCESEGENKGTTVTLTLPVDEGDATPATDV